MNPALNHEIIGPMEKTVSTLYLRALFDYLRSQNLDTTALRLGGLDPTEAWGERITAERFQTILAQAVALSGDPLLGLHVGEQIKPGYYGALGYVAMCCDNLGQALQKHLLYQRLVSDQGLVTLTLADGQATLRWQPHIADVDRQVVENIFSAWVCFGRWICGLPMRPDKVLFAHGSSAPRTEYERVFGCPVHFDQPVSALVLPTAFLDYPLVQADPALAGQFERQAELLTQRMQEEDDRLVRQLTVFMARNLSQGTLSLANAAAHVQMGPRALQRSLAKRGLRFSSLLDRTRQALAQQYLDDTDLSLLELTFMLDFADQASFQRAFKRWFGLSPGQWRLQATPPGATPVTVGPRDLTA